MPTASNTAAMRSTRCCRRSPQAKVAQDGKSVRLTISPLTKGHIHELHLDGVKSADGLPVLHPVGYYTLNEIPAK